MRRVLWCASQLAAEIQLPKTDQLLCLFHGPDNLKVRTFSFYQHTIHPVQTIRGWLRRDCDAKLHRRISCLLCSKGPYAPSGYLKLSGGRIIKNAQVCTLSRKKLPDRSIDGIKCAIRDYADCGHPQHTILRVEVHGKARPRIQAIAWGSHSAPPSLVIFRMARWCRNLFFPVKTCEGFHLRGSRRVRESLGPFLNRTKNSIEPLRRQRLDRLSTRFNLVILSGVTEAVASKAYTHPNRGIPCGGTPSPGFAYKWRLKGMLLGKSIGFWARVWSVSPDRTLQLPTTGPLAR